MIKYFKSRGFTDRLYIINFLLVIFITLCSFIFTVLSTALNINDTSVFNTALVSAWGELAIHTGFIISKSKKENSKKIALGMIKELAKTYGIEAVTPIIQTVLEE